MSFVNQTNYKIDLKCCSSWVGGKEHSLQTAQNNNKRRFLPFHLTEKHQICMLYWNNFIKKNCVKELCKKSIEKNYGIPLTRRKG